MSLRSDEAQDFTALCAREYLVECRSGRGLQAKVGNHVKSMTGKGPKKVLMVGHSNTVWDVGRLPLRIEGSLAYGPGIFDLKAGLIQFEDSALRNTCT